MLKEISSASVLVFPDFDKPFLLETDASKEGLGVVLSQKQDDGRYHPVAFSSSRTLTPSKQNYHSSKLEFLALKWSVTEHFKEYLACALFTVCMDNNPSASWTWLGCCVFAPGGSSGQHGGGGGEVLIG